MRLNIGGPKGNAFYIIGLVRQLETDQQKATQIIDEMKSRDYNNLLKVFKKYFPGVELYSNSKLPNVETKLYKITENEEL